MGADRLTDKKALVITGDDATGIAICTRLAAEGARVSRVVLAAGSGRPVMDHSRNSDLNRLGVSQVTADFLDSQSIDEVIGTVSRNTEPIDIAVNAYVRHAFASIDNVDDEMWLQEMEWNLGVTFRMIRSVSTKMKDRGKGSIVTVSSTAKDGVPWFSHRGHATHAAARGGVVGLTRSLAYELGRFNIRVNCVVPGPIKQPGMPSAFDSLSNDPDASVTPEAVFALKRYGTPEDVANAVLFFASDEATYVTGQTLYISGGLYY